MQDTLHSPHVSCDKDEAKHSSNLQETIINVSATDEEDVEK